MNKKDLEQPNSPKLSLRTGDKLVSLVTNKQTSGITSRLVCKLGSTNAVHD